MFANNRGTILPNKKNSPFSNVTTQAYYPPTPLSWLYMNLVFFGSQ
ncbi:MAG: hypothetical protein H6Q14_1968 [Bacteroidetes bacterium]|nr:hypothetical protein [Bacteroidota bacterium]